MIDRLVKVEASGNDFILGCGCWAPRLSTNSEAVQKLCNRRMGIGADGTLAVEVLDSATIRLHYRNSDGHQADFCANGARCAARFAHEILSVESHMLIETDWTTIGAFVEHGRVTLELPAAPAEPEARRLKAGGRQWKGWFVQVGVPHLVVPVEEQVEDLDVGRHAPPLRFHEDLAPHGANVNFVQITGEDTISVRSWERGVEGETLSCGSGVVAAALWRIRDSKLDRVQCLTRSGDVLEVEEAGSPPDRPLRLAGPARILASLEPHDDLI